MTAEAEIRAEALRLGFDAVGFTRALLPEAARARLEASLDAGHHGGMDWMERRVEQRAQPRALWPEAVSVIALGQNYGPEHDPLASLAWSDHATISATPRGATITTW